MLLSVSVDLSIFRPLSRHLRLCRRRIRPSADWHVGVRVVKSGLLVGFISAIPGEVRVYDKTVKIVEINFLCVHKKLRSKRVAPVLIREITRRVNLTGIFQAVYTAGVVLPKPIATCRYWHRSLNPKKLIQVRRPPFNSPFARTVAAMWPCARGKCPLFCRVH